MSRLAPPSNGALCGVKPPPGMVGGVGKPGLDWAWLAKAEHVIATANTVFKIAFFIVMNYRVKKIENSGIFLEMGIPGDIPIG